MKPGPTVRVPVQCRPGGFECDDTYTTATVYHNSKGGKGNTLGRSYVHSSSGTAKRRNRKSRPAASNRLSSRCQRQASTPRSAPQRSCTDSQRTHTHTHKRGKRVTQIQTPQTPRVTAATRKQKTSQRRIAQQPEMLATSAGIGWVIRGRANAEATVPRDETKSREKVLGWPSIRRGETRGE